MDDLAQALARAQDDRLAADLTRRQLAMKTALLADPRATDPPRRSPWVARALAIAAGVLLMFGAAWWLTQSTDARLTFTVGDDATDRVQASWIAAPNAPVEVEFSNGSTLVLAKGSRARVSTSEREGARIVLESGSVAIDTTPAPDKGARGTDGSTLFVVAAGPFEVALDHTACDVAWEGGTQNLGIVVHGGRVHVTGPDEQSHDVAAGQRVQISPRDALTSRPGGAVAQAPPAEPTLVPGDSAPTTAQPEPSKTRRRGTAAPDWSALARASKHKEALAAATAAGFGSLCDSLGPKALLRLADAARFAGDADKAAKALKALRRRHRRSGEAAVAAYTLGRIAAAKGRHAQAAGLFTTYLRERPRGSLAREALGRRLEAEAAAGWPGRADATARRYLELYPRGPHADLAAARSK